ncbi:superoxide dismutase family protein [Alkalihalobacillus sp. TS-13]|uniref:superoxide dismutase family protein n=1 Tax=Alkalihalobacillus sp. TS-13 TaxID=2842455 RepID=UPI001C86DB86|nr:superoxide dismutase family protein [Alkalihalobacillus sp. TS-13]
MKRWLSFLLVIIVLVILNACRADNDEDSDSKDTSLSGKENEGNTRDEVVPISVELKNGGGEKVGTADLEQQFSGVVIKIKASNLSPGKHGFHIHEKGVCEEPDFKSAGDHFNPTDVSHGEKEDGPHAGDLPNLQVGEDGTVETEITTDMVTLKSGEENSLIGSDGTTLIIHEEADDHKSQPSGDAGDRTACGVISDGS